VRRVHRAARRPAREWLPGPGDHRRREQITTIEGLGTSSDLHPMQQAFVAQDALQCGYCTPGQICSAVAMLDEVQQGWPSAVTADVADEAIKLDGTEIRERMSGNLCRCGAYANIITAITEAAR
jgi:xanthine dehydrogenase YagT iron-sulfur-binding subunit